MRAPSLLPPSAKLLGGGQALVDPYSQISLEIVCVCGRRARDRCWRGNGGVAEKMSRVQLIKMMNGANTVAVEVHELRPELKVNSSRSWVEVCDVALDEVEVAMPASPGQRRSFGPDSASVAFSRPGVPFG
jgi:hypothetical protein